MGLLSNHKNWLFVSFTQGSFGHMISRILATSPDVKWYDHPKNGTVPWEWNHFTADQSYSVSSSHFLRYFNTGDQTFNHENIVPAFGWFLNGTNADPSLFNSKWLTDILNQKILVYPTHDLPSVIRHHFPNSKIVVIDVDEDALPAVLKNQFEKTSNYRSIRRIPGLDNSKKIEWATQYDRDIIRDWEQYDLNLTQTEWFEYTCNWIIKDIKSRQEDFNNADYVFQSKDKTNISKIIELHKNLNLRYKEDDIRHVLTAFDLDCSIATYLNREGRTQVSCGTQIE